jgi:hypothetical protein
LGRGKRRGACQKRGKDSSLHHGQVCIEPNDVLRIFRGFTQCQCVTQCEQHLIDNPEIEEFGSRDQMSTSVCCTYGSLHGDGDGATIIVRQNSKLPGRCSSIVIFVLLLLWFRLSSLFTMTDLGIVISVVVVVVVDLVPQRAKDTALKRVKSCWRN